MLEVAKEVVEPCLTPEEVSEYSVNVERIVDAELSIDGMKASLAQRLAELHYLTFEHRKFLKVLSQKYQVPMYDNSYDVELLTGKIIKKEKPQ